MTDCLSVDQLQSSNNSCMSQYIYPSSSIRLLDTKKSKSATKTTHKSQPQPQPQPHKQRDVPQALQCGLAEEEGCRPFLNHIQWSEVFVVVGSSAVCCFSIRSAFGFGFSFPHSGTSAAIVPTVAASCSCGEWSWFYDRPRWFCGSFSRNLRHRFEQQTVSGNGRDLNVDVATIPA